ncbi:unnamed protein product, partial [Rotaria magnacalcarata]
FVQTISCYTCTAGDDLFNVDSPNVIRCLSTCSYCYKLTVFIAYAPMYTDKECVWSCTPSYSVFDEFKTINIKSKRHDRVENFIVELPLQRLAAQQLLAIDPPPNV